MKKAFNITVVVLFIIGIFLLGRYLVFSCFSSPPGVSPDIPYGVWQSSEPEITVSIDPANETPRYPGTYVKNGESIDIFVQFQNNENGFRIYYADAYNNDTGEFYGNRFLFKGTFELSDDRITYFCYEKDSNVEKEYTFVKIAELEERKPL